MRYNVFYEINGKKFHKVVTQSDKNTKKIKKAIEAEGGTNIKVSAIFNGTEGNL